ncbi:SGNH/GDSL hydrolase family protein [Frateuria sp. GZRR35]|uniref:SGNH/GDSL hydrolase family protein n=1 Tax=unclassified Frateuria TaxID=2648894 RepID=UPI003EDC2A4C
MKRAIALCLAMSFSHASASQSRQILIEEYGDSTTTGYTIVDGRSLVTSANEPNILQRLVRADFGDSVVVSNEGVGGIESWHALTGNDGVHANWESLMSKSQAQIITLNFALNDAYYNRVPAPDALNEGPQTYNQILTQLVGIAKKHGKIVVLYEPNPSCHPTKAGLVYYVMQIGMVSNATQTPLVAQYWSIVSMPNWQDMLSDCTHPKDELYRIKAQNAYKVLKPIIRGLTG